MAKKEDSVLKRQEQAYKRKMHNVTPGSSYDYKSDGSKTPRSDSRNNLIRETEAANKRRAAVKAGTDADANYRKRQDRNAKASSGVHRVESVVEVLVDTFTGKNRDGKKVAGGTTFDEKYANKQKRARETTKREEPKGPINAIGKAVGRLGDGGKEFLKKQKDRNK